MELGTYQKTFNLFLCINAIRTKQLIFFLNFCSRDFSSSVERLKRKTYSG